VSPPGASMMMKSHSRFRRASEARKRSLSSASALSRSRSWLASTRTISGIESLALVFCIQRVRFSR
jgi:hypothetical protein